MQSINSEFSTLLALQVQELDFRAGNGRWVIFVTTADRPQLMFNFGGEVKVRNA